VTDENARYALAKARHLIANHEAEMTTGERAIAYASVAQAEAMDGLTRALEGLKATLTDLMLHRPPP
jgi:hypothetical protein